VLQFKTLFRPLDTNEWGWGLAVGAVRHPGGEAAQLRREFDHPANLKERELPAVRVGGQPQPTVRFLKDALGELEFGATQLLEIGGRATGGGAHEEVQGVLRGIGQARLKGSGTSRPVELGREPADGAERTAG